MKRKDITTIHQMKPDELKKAISETEKKLEEIMVNRYSKPSKNNRETRELRKKIAVASTVLREKELIHDK